MITWYKIMFCLVIHHVHISNFVVVDICGDEEIVFRLNEKYK